MRANQGKHKGKVAIRSVGNMLDGLEMLPLVAVALAVAVLHWKRHPRVAIVAGGAAAFLAVVLMHRFGNWFILTAGILVTGIVLALSRWQQHQRVSALVAGSLAAYLGIVLMQRFGLLFLVQWLQGKGLASPGIPHYLDLSLGVLSMIVQTGAWAGMLVAAFGWRECRSNQVRRTWQFSVRSLLLLTLVAALLSSQMRLVAGRYADAAALGIPYAAVLVMGVGGMLPVICWLVGAWLAITRSTRHPQVSRGRNRFPCNDCSRQLSPNRAAAGAMPMQSVSGRVRTTRLQAAQKDRLWAVASAR